MSTIAPGARVAGALIVVAAMLVACGATSSPPSDAGVTSPTPSTTAASDRPSSPLSPSAGPASEPGGGEMDPVEEPTGELYALDCRGDGPCRLEFLPDGGTDEPGWPVIVSGPCRGTAKVGDAAYAACDSADGALVHAFDADANPLGGWPVRLPGSVASVYDNLITIACGAERSSLRIAADGSIVVAIADADAAMLHRLTPDGEPLPAWPRPFPGDPPGEDGIGGNGCRGFTFAPDGDIVAWGYQGVESAIELIAARTEFTVFAPDGTTRPGWPRGSVGAASRPVVGDDGSIWYTSASGKVWRHGPDGEIAAGWPYQLADQAVPYLAPDDRVVVLVSDDDDESDQAISLDGDGDVTRGWPVALEAGVETRCLFGDTPCVGDVEPAIGPDGTLFVALGSGWDYGSDDASDRGGSIVAIQPDGDVPPGWPVPLGERAHAVGLTVGADGRLTADVATCGPDGCGDDDWKRSTVVLAPDGTPVGSGG